MHENDITGLDTGADDEGAVAGRGGDEQARRLLEGPALGYGEEGELGDAELGGEGALAGAEDAGSDGELGLLLAVARGGEDCACELGARYEGEGCSGFSCKQL